MTWRWRRFAAQLTGGFVLGAAAYVAGDAVVEEVTSLVRRANRQLRRAEAWVARHQGVEA